MRLKAHYHSQMVAEIDFYKQTLDIKDLIRERLKGIRPNHPEDNTILQNHLAGLDDASRLAFLSKAHDVTENTTFKVVLTSLMIESEHKGMIDSVDMEEVNFNRASINGLMLMEEELTLLDKSYKVEKSHNDTMTDEERLSTL